MTLAKTSGEPRPGLSVPGRDFNILADTGEPAGPKTGTGCIVEGGAALIRPWKQIYCRVRARPIQRLLLKLKGFQGKDDQWSPS